MTFFRHMNTHKSRTAIWFSFASLNCEGFFEKQSTNIKYWLRDVVKRFAMIGRRRSSAVVVMAQSPVIPDLNCACEMSVLLSCQMTSSCLNALLQIQMLQMLIAWLLSGGTLFKWWRIVNRAFSIVGVFEHLRVKKQKGVTLKDRYVETVQSLKQKQGKQNKMYSYGQAAIYDRLGKFLLKYPRFVYQLQLVSLKNWFQNVGGGKMITCLEAKGAFWMQSPLLPKGN
jgi:hypothetical protein